MADGKLTFDLKPNDDEENCEKPMIRPVQQ